MTHNTSHEWQTYQEKELALLTPLLAAEGFVLDETQPHLSGERFLMQAVTTTSGRKLILLAHEEDTEKRVVIKASREKNGIKEIEHERLCRAMLAHIPFAYKIFFVPREVAAFDMHGFIISVQEFIPQEKAFLERPLEEQFSYARTAFLTQESAHAATFEQARRIKKTFGSMDASEYIALFETFRAGVARTPESAHHTALLARAQAFLETHIETIEQYGNFLTHTDFVPHNFRIHEGRMYLLDASSIRFGNKYEGWARFLNFMTLHNPLLEQALMQYVKDNRAPEESLALTLMRVYRLGEIIWYYSNSLSAISGDLHTLNTARVAFWSALLESILDEKPFDASILETYRATRDSLRSPEEHARQRGLH